MSPPAKCEYLRSRLIYRGLFRTAAVPGQEQRAKATGAIDPLQHPLLPLAAVLNLWRAGYETIYARRSWPRRSPTIIGLALRMKCYPALMSLGKTFHRHVYLKIRGIWLSPNGGKVFGRLELSLLKINFLSTKIYAHKSTSNRNNY